MTNNTFENFFLKKNYGEENEIECISEEILDSELALNKGGCSRITDCNGTAIEYACNSCDHKSKELYAMKKHIKDTHFLVKNANNDIIVDLEPIIGVTMEKKKYTLNELKALEKKRNYVDRDNSIRDDKGYKLSSSIDLSTAAFEYMKMYGFSELHTIW